jgi:predicted HTH domain antitoxin
MQAVRLLDLKSDPEAVLRKARAGPVVVMDADKPGVVLVSINEGPLLDTAGVKAALATALLCDGDLSLARSAGLMGLSLQEFAKHVSQLGIPVSALDSNETASDMDTLEKWLSLPKCTLFSQSR